MATSRPRDGRHSASERDLVAGVFGEIGDLIADLDLGSASDAPAAPTPTPAFVDVPADHRRVQTAVRPRPKRRPRPRPTVEAPAAAVTSAATVWPARAATPAPAATPDGALELVGRPWSLAAAMEPLAPLAPQAPSMTRPAGADEDGGSWLMTAVVVLALLVAAAVVIATHVDLGRTNGPPFGVAGLATRTATGGTPSPGGHYPQATTEIDYTCNYSGAKPGDTLVFHITSQPSAAGAPVLAFPDADRSFNAGDATAGELRGTITPPGHSFTPGTYTLQAIHNGTVLNSTIFIVDETAPATPGP